MDIIGHNSSLTMAWQLILAVILAAASALPADPVISKLNPERYQYVWDGNGKPHLVDMWLKVSDLQQMARFTADTDNEYHLYTRFNPTVSHPIIMNNVTSLNTSYFSSGRRTIIVVHGWMNDASSDMFTVLIPAYLEVEDVNVISVDWSAGAETLNYLAATVNTVSSGESVARFITWLNTASGANVSSYHLIGHSLGGHQVGVIGRNLDGEVPYITALDPALPGFLFNDDKFSSSDGIYTEVIHTNAGILGYGTPMGHVDFYPNGGNGMTGCLTVTCDHGRSYFYMAESISSGGFLGQECDSYLDALLGACSLDQTLNMGGPEPKTGYTGIFYLETNADSPFSQDE